MNTTEDILMNDWKFGTIDFHSIFFFYYGSQWYVPIVLQNIFLCVQQKKETYTGLQQLEGE